VRSQQPVGAESLGPQHCPDSRPGGAPNRPIEEIYIDGELEMVDTTNWFPKVLRKDFTVGMVVSENGLDDPNQNFYENYACGAARN
jgi:hypothetical protein